MGEECLICKDRLEYLKADVLMECAICHKKENSKTRCVRGHYVCNECHTQGMDAIVGLCMAETSKNPVAIIEKMMQMPFCHMHGPEHHVMVGAALLTAFKSAGGEIDLRAALAEMVNRGKSVPGGACGFWGACGAGVSTGMFVSIISGLHAAHGRAVCPVASDDGERAWRRSGRSAARAAASGTRFWPSGRQSACEGALRDRDGAGGHGLPFLPAECAVRRQTVPVFRGKSFVNT